MRTHMRGYICVTTCAAVRCDLNVCAKADERMLVIEVVCVICGVGAKM